MSIYRVATPASPAKKIHVAFGSSEGAARAARRELAEAHGFKLGDVAYAPIDLQPGKAGLIAYLNAFHAEVPADYVPAGYAKEAAKSGKKR